MSRESKRNALWAGAGVMLAVLAAWLLTGQPPPDAAAFERLIASDLGVGASRDEIHAFLAEHRARFDQREPDIIVRVDDRHLLEIVRRTVIVRFHLDSTGRLASWEATDHLTGP